MKRKPIRRRRKSGATEAVIQCQYCNESMVVCIDLLAGRTQKFDYDCEVCCHPLEVSVSISDDGEITAQAVRA